MKPNKFWIVLLCSIIVVSAAIAILTVQAPASTAHVYQNGTLIKEIDLSAISGVNDYTIEENNRLNIIRAEQGRIRMYQANCPDGTCVRQGWISDGAIPIVCLPHRLVIKLDTESALSIDAIIG